MENKLTNSEKAKVFAMYMRCTVKIEGEDEECETEAVNIEGAVFTNLDGQEAGNHIGSVTMVLTPLSKISNEDAITVALIEQTFPAVLEEDHPKADEVDCEPHEMTFDDRKRINVSCRCFHGYTDIYFDGKIAMHDEDDKMEPIYELGMMHQCLISMGYAVPLFFSPNHWANGKTALELGIAIEADCNIAIKYADTIISQLNKDAK